MLLLSLGCAPVEQVTPAPPAPQPPQEATAADAPGPYSIGVSTIETVADGEGKGRSFPVEIWYPASPERDAEPTIYTLYLGALKAAEFASPLGAVRDAPLDRRGAPHPVVVFSHGYGGTRLQSIYLTEYLASHGFVVAAPDHVGNTFAEQVNSAAALTDLEAARLRPGDVSRSLDALLVRSANWPADLLAFGADPERVGVAGHSFGGFTTFRIAGGSIDLDAADAACSAEPDHVFCKGWPGETPMPASARDERFMAALPQAPGGALVFEPNGLSDVAVPTMIQAGTKDKTTPYDEEATAPYGLLPKPGYLLSIEDAGHFSFSNMCSLVELIGLSVEAFDDGCSDDNIAEAQAHAISNTYAVAFFKQYLAGDDSYADWLSGELAPPKAASLESK